MIFRWFIVWGHSIDTWHSSVRPKYHKRLFNSDFNALWSGHVFGVKLGFKSLFISNLYDYPKPKSLGKWRGVAKKLLEWTLIWLHIPMTSHTAVCFTLFGLYTCYLTCTLKYVWSRLFPLLLLSTLYTL